MLTANIQKQLFQLQDQKYREFQASLIPTLDPKTIIGVRTPILRQYAKKLIAEPNIEEFLQCLPHRFFEENQLHAFIISREKDFDKCAGQVERFLPYIDNWATCDQLSLPIFQKQPARLLPLIYKWIKSENTYTVRFAIGVLMKHFLDEEFNQDQAELVVSISSQEYYIKTMIAWYFATALVKQYDSILPFFEQKSLDDWTHNKAIQKARESRRIKPEQKAYLQTLKVKRVIHLSSAFPPEVTQIS